MLSATVPYVNVIITACPASLTPSTEQSTTDIRPSPPPSKTVQTLRSRQRSTTATSTSWLTRQLTSESRPSAAAAVSHRIICSPVIVMLSLRPPRRQYRDATAAPPVPTRRKAARVRRPADATEGEARVGGRLCLILIIRRSRCRHLMLLALHLSDVVKRTRHRTPAP